jgi:hypothetical protein
VDVVARAQLCHQGCLVTESELFHNICFLSITRGNANAQTFYLNRLFFRQRRLQ